MRMHTDTRSDVNVSENQEANVCVCVYVFIPFASHCHLTLFY